MKKLIVIALMFFVSHRSNSQNPIVEIDFENQTIERLKGAVLNDSLFLTIEGLRTATTVKRNFYWVKADGGVRTLQLNLNKNHSIYAVGYTEDEEYYYYPVEFRNRAFLRAIILNKKTSELREGIQEVEIPERFMAVTWKRGGFIWYWLKRIVIHSNFYALKVLR